LRQAQIAMLQGKVKIEGNDLVTTGGKIPLSSEVADYLRRNTAGKLSHPFYWSAFTIVGSPW
jgi:CHAT domain-containing protein